MSVSLNPITRDKLDQFERRRRRLVLVRGICAGLVSFLALMTLIATADWLWILPSSARWTMSIAGYLGTGLVVWLTCVRLLVRIPSRHELAQFVETTAPDLREQLLSAIELCTDDPSSVHDSPVFRQLLQDQVGRQMETVQIASLLPMGILARWLLASLGIVALFFLLMTLPGFPFRLLMTRAILPGANLDRVSRVQVEILQPTPHSLTAPRNEAVAIIVEISGPAVDEVTLETRSPSGEVVQQAMRPNGPMQFAANISVEEESVDYRILAGDAVTRRYTIRSEMRPYVVAYHKTFRPPEYAKMPERTASESHGDLIALEGTEAEVVFELDQPVSQAELRLERSGSDEVTVVPLTEAGPLRYRAEMPIKTPGIYQVHLVSEETGFDNPFSPKCEIRPEPDLIPRVGFVGMEETTLILPPSDILDLEGLAEDDLPLAELKQQISVNGREWLDVPLPIEEETSVTVDWQWDMLDLNLKSGDQVSTRLVATDRKGNEGESIPLQIVIASPDFDPNRHEAMELKEKLFDRLVEFAATVREHNQTAIPVMDRLREDPAIAEIEPADRATLLDLAHKIREEGDEVVTLALEILPKMPAGVDAEDVELVARLVARIQSDRMQIPATYLDLPRNADDSSALSEDLTKVAEAFSGASDDAKQLHERFQDLLTHNILAAAAADLDAIHAYQARLVDSKVPLSWERLLRQETVITSQMRAVEQLIRKHTSRLNSHVKERIRGNLEWIAQRRSELEESMESEDQLARLRERAQRLADELPRQQEIATLDGNLSRRLVEARSDFRRRIGSLAKPIQHASETAKTVATDTARLGETNDSAESQKVQVSIDRAKVLLTRLRNEGSSRLSSRRNSTQARPDADTQYASDAALTRRALIALLNRFSEEGPAESEIPDILHQIAGAYAVLEAGHDAVQLDKDLGDLASRERWQSQEVWARLDHPRRWDAFHEGCEFVARAMRDADYPSNLSGKFDHLRWSRPANEAGGKIGARRWRHEDRAAAAYELAELKTETESALDEMAPIMAEARALIAQYAPTLPQMARQAAEEVRRLEEETEKAAENLAQTDPQAPADQMDQVEQRQEEVNRQLDDLLDALAEDANQQDLLTEEGRERARDADDSTRMIEEPAEQMNLAMEQASTTQEPDDQARELSKTADHQERTADALEKVAEHYERLESGENVDETRQALRQAERDMGIARQMDQQYSDAAELAEMAAKTPQELMAELEEELAHNPAMQEALSEISQDALAQAQQSLEHSANREADMERSVENSDREFREQKQALAEELRELGQTASALAHRQAYQATSMASQGKDQEGHEQLDEARDKLSQGVSQAERANPDTALDELLEQARQTAEQAAEAAAKFREGEQSTAQAKNENIHRSEEQRADHQRRFEESQKNFHEQMKREARDRVHDRQRDEQRAQEQVRREEREAKAAQDNANRQREALNRDPESSSAQRASQEADQRNRREQEELQRAQQALDRAKQQREEAEKATEALEKKELPSLNSPNPAAELANRYAKEAAEIAEQIAKRAEELAKQPEWAEQLAPEHETLKRARDQQEEIGIDVEQASEDVARAGRHEARLEKAELARQLAEKSQDILDVAEGEVLQSERELEDAVRESDPNEESRNGNQQALQAHDSIGQAEEAIRDQAAAVEDALAPPESSSEAGDMEPMMAGTPSTPQSTPQSGPPSRQATPEEAARAEMLARTLDELDRSMAGSASAPSSPTNTPTPPSALAQAAQSQANQMSQARMQARMAAQTPGREGAEESELGAMLVDQAGGNEALKSVARAGDDWGKLRGKSAEDTVGSGRDAVPAEYRKQVETYFRVIAERARKKK